MNFNSPEQPPTSNPADICNRYLKIAKTGDKHASDIVQNIAGILKGANIKYHEEIIKKSELEKIKDILSTIKYESFYPLIF